MTTNTSKCLTLLVACLTAMAATPTMARQHVVVKHPPVVSRGDLSPTWDAQQNVNESKQYDRLLKTNRAFREARMRRECGPITDPELHASCLASFDEKTPYIGSSAAPRQHGSNAGR